MKQPILGIAEACHNSGLDYFDKGLYDQAIADFTRAIEINPWLAEAHVNRGIAYEKKGQIDQAIADYNKAIEINPGLAESYHNRGVAYFNKGQHDQAIADFTRAIEINPGHAEAYHNRAFSYVYIKEYDNAWNDVEKAQALGVRINPILKMLLEDSFEKRLLKRAESLLIKKGVEKKGINKASVFEKERLTDLRKKSGWNWGWLLFLLLMSAILKQCFIR